MQRKRVGFNNRTVNREPVAKWYSGRLTRSHSSGRTLAPLLFCHVSHWNSRLTYVRRVVDCHHLHLVALHLSPDARLTKYERYHLYFCNTITIPIPLLYTNKIQDSPKKFVRGSQLDKKVPGSFVKIKKNLYILFILGK